MLGSRIQGVRKQNKLTLKEFANKIGVSESMVSRYEAESRAPSYDILSKISMEFEVSTDYLLGHTDDPSPPSTAPDAEMWELRDQLHKRPEMKALLHASKNVKKEDIETLAKLMESFKKDEWME